MLDDSFPINMTNEIKSFDEIIKSHRKNLGITHVSDHEKKITSSQNKNENENIKIISELKNENDLWKEINKRWYNEWLLWSEKYNELVILIENNETMIRNVSENQKKNHELVMQCDKTNSNNKQLIEEFIARRVDFFKKYSLDIATNVQDFNLFLNSVDSALLTWANRINEWNKIKEAKIVEIVELKSKVEWLEKAEKYKISKQSLNIVKDKCLEKINEKAFYNDNEDKDNPWKKWKNKIEMWCALYHDNYDFGKEKTFGSKVWIKPIQTIENKRSLGLNKYNSDLNIFKTG